MLEYASGLAGAVLGFILDGVGYVANAESQSETVLTALRLCATLGAAAAAIVALVVFLLMYTLKEKDLEQMNAELNGLNTKAATQEWNNAQNGWSGTTFHMRDCKAVYPQDNFQWPAAETCRYDITKIITAVTKASDSVGGQSRLTKDQITQIAADVTDQCQSLNRAVSVEEVQDMVENQLMDIHAHDIARHYITYRYIQSLKRHTFCIPGRIINNPRYHPHW